MPPWIVDQNKFKPFKIQIAALLIASVLVALVNPVAALFVDPWLLAFALFRATQYYGLIMTISELKLNIEYHKKIGDYEKWAGNPDGK